MTTSPHLSELDALFNRKFPFMGKAIGDMSSLFGSRWQASFEQFLSKVMQSPDEKEKAVNGYVRFALDIMRLQKQFEKTGAYPEKSFDQARADVYDNAEYMQTAYLPGLLLSHFLWPHHYRQQLFFETAFLNIMRRQGAQRFLDCGTGTGYNACRILDTLPETTGRAFDISPHSKAHAEQQAEALGVGSRLTVDLQNLITDPPDETTDWLISIEVLEHLEEPVAFLKALRGLLNKEGKAFITAAINAAEADHITLYRSTDGVAEQILEAGFAIEQSHTAWAYAPEFDGQPIPQVAAFVVTSR
ncbi:MAG: class I SAM-dependent methyltransferase [Magnetococcales bacterium]|nr:class I SAM-dependent methyltransferase [Magnetococcales bacterium]